MRRITLLSILLLCAAAQLGAATATAQSKGELELPATDLDEPTRILHALNRLGFGPRPGDLDRVREAGLEAYILAQLDPAGIDDSGVEARLAAYPTLGMTPTELLTAFPPPPLLQGLGKQLTARGMASRAEVQSMFPELERIEQRKNAEQTGDGGARSRGAQDPAARLARLMDSPQRIVMELAQAKLIRAVHGERQLQEVMTDFWFNHFNVYAAKSADRWWVTTYERDAIRPHALGRFRDLLGATAEHPAMLIYLDNWLSSAPGAEFDRRLANRYAAEANDAQGLPPGGVATLILRDRGMDTRDLERRIERRDRAARSGRPAASRGAAGSEPQPRRSGLNENYARELLELHTLGVDGGYTQADVEQVARCFTGWTLLPLQAGQQFVFMPELHVRGKKQVLGSEIKNGGIDEGRAVLDLLARHPSTARFIATKLARRFVSDDPPPALVEAMADTFLESDGDIREVLLTMIGAEEFWSADAVNAKVKTPLEFVASLLRATGAHLSDLPGIAPGASEDPAVTTMSGTMLRSRMPGALGALRDLGQPLYGAQPPTGYGDTASAWVSTGAMLQRFKVGFAVAAERLPGIRLEVAPQPRGTDTDVYLRELGRELIGRTPSPETLAVLREQLELPAEELEELGVPARYGRSPSARSRLALAWLAASPEFQRK